MHQMMDGKTRCLSPNCISSKSCYAASSWSALPHTPRLQFIHSDAYGYHHHSVYELSKGVSSVQSAHRVHSVPIHEVLRILRRCAEEINHRDPSEMKNLAFEGAPMHVSNGYVHRRKCVYVGTEAGARDHGFQTSFHPRNLPPHFDPIRPPLLPAPPTTTIPGPKVPNPQEQTTRRLTHDNQEPLGSTRAGNRKRRRSTSCCRRATLLPTPNDPSRRMTISERTPLLTFGIFVAGPST